LVNSRRLRRASKEEWVRKHAVKALVLACVVALLSSQAQVARADGDDVKGNIAGTIGLGLLGAEVGLLLPPAFKLQDQWWAWVLFPTVLAAGGAVAGALTFDPGDPKPAVTVSLLAAGMALALPAVVGAVALKDKRNAQETAMDGGVIRFGSNRRWGVPSVSTRPVYSAGERLRYGVQQRTMVQIPLVSGRF
jgi:peptidoglycan/LPS O-acetylase OafA/YrhL